MDEFIQLIIFAALILLSTVFSRKKKKPGGSAPLTPRAPRPEVTATTRDHVREQPRHVVRADRPRMEPSKQPGSFREFFEVLQQQAEAATHGEPLEFGHDGEIDLVLDEPPEPLPAPVRQERPPAQTIETLEAAGGKSHERFHEKYIGPIDAPSRKLPPRFVLPRDPVSLKRAVIWSEILGSPKGLE